VVIAAWHFLVNIIEDKPLSSLWAQKNPGTHDRELKQELKNEIS
jgi:hypothetical protein